MAAAMMMHSCKTQYSICVLVQFSYNKVFLIRYDGELSLVASLSQTVGFRHGWWKKVVENMIVMTHYHTEERVVEFVNELC